MKMSSKISATLGFIVFFFFFFLTSTYEARDVPAFSTIMISSKTQHGVLEEESVNVEESCDGIGGEECLMRRTLVAHTDYIYTQKQKP
ncbi:hypothetical protein RJT34_25301 [Clitoria ternatea]|uniref:Phytosulfokine n=1 Tax=Clitoria ternatea TaxID=43366 RepID=A0AAN9IIR9_CLITE